MKKYSYYSIKELWPYYLFYLLIFAFTMNTPFFWDKDIILSKRAFWFIENNFSLAVPIDLDTAYIPVLSYVMAILWKIFGAHLWVGHALMIPLGLGLVYQFYRFLEYLSPQKHFIHFTLILLLIDTTLLSQIVVVSNDLMLAFFFFWSLNAIIYNKKNVLYFALIGLVVSHLRGVTTCVIVYLFQLFWNYYVLKTRQKFIPGAFNALKYYLPSALIIMSYSIYHYLYAGWLVTSESSPWYPCFEKVDFKGLIYNIGILVWRLIDYGKLFYWLVGFYTIAILVKKKIKADKNLTWLLIIMGLIALGSFPSMVMYKMLNAHRYILVLYCLLIIVVGYLVFNKLSNKKLQKATFIILLLGSITGNFWIYPDHIAKGWDSTIAHLPYHHLRKKMITYMDNEYIPINQTGSGIPNVSKFKYITLDNDNRQFQSKNLEQQSYIFYSNIYNMFTDEQVYELKNQWTLIQEYSMLQVKVALYKNPTNESKQ